MSHKFGGLDPTEKARIGATLIRCRVLAAKIATAWRGCNNARCYKTRLWNTRVTAGNADGARVSALCNKKSPPRKRRDCYSPARQAKGVLPAGCYAASVTWSALQKTNPIRARHMTVRAVPAARHPQQTSTKPAAEAPRNERANHFFALLCGPGR